MSAEKIPAEVEKLARRIVRRIVPHPLKLEYQEVAEILMADRSTRSAEPAPEVEVGDGLLADTGCTSLDDLRDKAAIGVSLMERIADLCKPGSRHEHWAPADDPAEIVFDLANEADDLRRERDEARADRGTIDAEADHWKTEAKNIESDLERTLQARDEARDALETIARTEKSLLASLSRALQDRDEAVRVAVEDERDRLYRKANADYIAAEERGDTIAQEAHAAAAYWLGLNDGKSVDDRTIARRARLRADQRAGDGATPSVKQEQADRGYGLGFTRGMTAEQLDEAERHCLAMFDQRGDHGGSPGEYWAEALMEIETARARRAGDGGAA